MSYDALVWLLVGLGAGVGGSLLLLIGYAALERGRLGRRLRQARATAVATEPMQPVDAEPAVPPQATKPPAPEAKSRSVLVTAGATSATPAPAATTTSKPAAAPPAVVAASPVVAAAPQRIQSVEAMFAEAFANDRLTAPPKPDEDANPPKG